MTDTRDYLTMRTLLGALGADVVVEGTSSTRLFRRAQSGLLSVQAGRVLPTVLMVSRELSARC